ncbi:MAG: TonB family protein [Mucilaginibacter sp.]|uniref:energy transducer TonB n=1 Tax=Mucilaginibacter sp. TaxID=1882438 RepID=UPI0032632113
MLGSNLDIMSPQWTDVIFKDRNQAYGAYQLRKDNNHNTARALLIATSLFAAVLVIPTIINKIQGIVPKAASAEKRIEVTILLPIKILHEKVIPAAQQKQVVAQKNMVQSKPMVVAPDNQAHVEPPTNKQFETADPGPATITGTKGAGVAIDEKQGTEAVPGTNEGTDKNIIFQAAEFNPEYPGGEAAFAKFLQSHIRYPNIAKENGVQGRVFIQFVVERDGSLTDMKIVGGPGSGLGEEAVRVLKMSPHWKPGSQNGQQVRVQYTVPVSFALSE